MAYKSIVRPSMEYACIVWNPHTVKYCALLDAVQNRAARWVLKSSLFHFYLGKSITAFKLALLKWLFLQLVCVMFCLLYLSVCVVVS